MKSNKKNTLLKAAQNEEKKTCMDDHALIIKLLRDEKKFTFREIADWFSKHGLHPDHNAVYRTYAKRLKD